MGKALTPAQQTRMVEVSGDLRKLTINVLQGLIHGDVKRDDAAVFFKGVKEVNVSLYSEIKHMSLLVEMGKLAPELGALPLYNQSEK